MNEIWLETPRVVRDGTCDRFEFAWRVEPETELYQRTTFFLRVPSPPSDTTFPDRLLWLLALLCLHPQWTLLRPCRIHLPVRLGSGEAEFWLRLLDATVVTLEAHRGGNEVQRTIEIIEDGPALAEVRPLPDKGLCAAAFSGGKDSLLQAGLLTEIVSDVLLVNTCSPMWPLHDHVSERRRYVLREIAARRPAVTLVEVDSDLRSSWLNGFPPTVGYQVSVNELIDTFLYLAALIAAAWTRGATHLFLASEAEVQESAELDGNIVQHPHAMYSVVTQSAVSSLLSRVGMSYGSLLSPLRSQQIQQLLWTRYPDLADLQYSCWRVAPDEATCSRCSQCLRVAFAALSIGESPARMGINLVNLMHALHGWEPRRMAGPLVLPGDRVTADLHAQTVRTIVMTPLLRFAKALGRRRYTPRGLLAIDRFRRLRRRLGRQTVAAARGYRPAYLACVDPLVREPIAGIYAAAFSPDDATEQETNRRRGERLIRHITEPLSVASINEGDV